MNTGSLIRREAKKIRLLRQIYHKWLKIKWKVLSYNTKRVFVEKYQTNRWGSEESVSGLGSELRQTATIRQQIPSLCTKYRINSFLDLPCGDFNWMQHVHPFFDAYIGADIVPQLIADNKNKYSQFGAFLELNLLKDELPAADVLFCRDCLVHFSYSDFRRAISNIKKSEIKYLLTTTYPKREANHDINTGQWRPINLEAAPFYFPPPQELIIENSTEQDGLVQDKCLGLWLIKDIP